MERKQLPCTMKCVECDFRSSTTNEMCRHIFGTGHGAIKCPVCDTYIVPRAFLQSLQKLVERRRERLAAGGAAELTLSSSTSSPLLPLGASARATEPMMSIDVRTHHHCLHYPEFQSYEKEDFCLPPDALGYGLPLEGQADLQSSLSSVSRGHLPSTTEQAVAPPAASTLLPFRCMECLSHCPTWTQVTKHIDLTNHTLPICVQCGMRLKCFGPQRPSQHEAATMHCGYYGTYYTRRDYRCDMQAARSVYNSANLYTGLTTLQYKCVCGVSFLHPVHLADHLRTVHRVTVIADAAVCHGCGMRGTLHQLRQHLRKPCWETADGKLGTLPAFLKSAPTNALAAEAVAIARLGVSEAERDASLDELAAASHLVEVDGFSGASFLQYRPLLPPLTEAEVPLMSETVARSSGRGDSTSVDAQRQQLQQLRSATPSQQPQQQQQRYAVFYQCRECLSLFSNWDRTVMHIMATGHCSTYCTECRDYLHALSGYSSGDSTTPARSQHLRDSASLVVGAAPGGGQMPRTTTLAEHIAHLSKHGDMIGYPASPETMEVLVDVSANFYRGSFDPPSTAFTTERTVMVYQCPDQHQGCYRVFLRYGELVAHLLSTGHGLLPADGTSSAGAANASVRQQLPTCYPMVSYAAKFSVDTLCSHFNFACCVYCSMAVPKHEFQLHSELCAVRRIHLARAAR